MEGLDIFGDVCDNSLGGFGLLSDHFDILDDFFNVGLIPLHFVLDLYGQESMLLNGMHNLGVAFIELWSQFLDVRVETWKWLLVGEISIYVFDWIKAGIVMLAILNIFTHKEGRDMANSACLLRLGGRQFLCVCERERWYKCLYLYF